MEWTCYKLFDENGRLLYVGCSSRPVERIDQHLRKPWAKKIRGIKMSPPFKDQRDALALENFSLWHENPRYNVRRNGGAFTPKCYEDKMEVAAMRRDRIRQMRKGGASVVAIAEFFDISSQRVYAILGTKR